MVDVNLSPAEMERQLKDKKWETAQIKGLTSWANTYLNKDEMPIVTLQEDVKNGVRLGLLLERLSSTNKKIAGMVKKPKHKVEMLQNSSIVLKFATEQLGIRLVGVGAEDIVNGELKMILGFLWTTFRKVGLSSLNSKSGRGGANPEEDLLNWVREKVQPYGVDVVSFRQSFNDGVAWAALVDAFDPDYLNFANIDRNNREATLNAVFDAAEKHLGIPRLLDVQDLLNDTADDRSITLYTSLFYHAFITNADKIKLNDEKRGLTHTSQDVESQLRAVRQAIEALRPDHLQSLNLRRDHALAVESSDARLRALQAEVDAMKREKADLERRLRELSEQRMATLQQDLKDMYNERDQMKKRTQENVSQRQSLAAESFRRQDELDKIMRNLRAAGLFASSDADSGFDDEAAAAGIGRLGSASNIDALRSQLRAHVNALHHKWNDMAATSEDKVAVDAMRAAQAQFARDSAARREAAAAKKPAERTAAAVKDLAITGETLVNVLSVRDARAEMNSVVSRRGILVAQEDGKRWKKRWFVLRGFVLSYFENKEEQDNEPSGTINLEDSMISSIDSKDSKLPWIIKIVTTVESNGEKRKEVLQVAAKSKDDRDEWFFVLHSCVLYTHYLALIKSQNARPDVRILDLFEKRTLRVLQLDDQPLDALALKVLEKLVHSHPECERFSLANAKINDEAMMTLASILQRRDSVAGINLSGNGLSAAGIENLVDGARLGNLQDALLSHNNLDDAAVKTLCEALSGSLDLRRLDLSYNKISGSCMQDLQLLYKELNQLTEVELGHNDIGDDTVVELCPLLSFTSSVSAVDLSFNRIGDDGVVALCASLKDSASVREVNLGGNVFGSRGLAAIHTLMTVNTNICVLFSNDHHGILSDDVVFPVVPNVTVQQLNLHRV